MQRIVNDFRFPVVYPNGVIEYCDNEEEQRIKQNNINLIVNEMRRLEK